MTSRVSSALLTAAAVSSSATSAALGPGGAARRAAFSKTVVNLKGVLTEVWTSRSGGGAPLRTNINTQIIVLPGNPGVAGYYEPFCRSLQSKVGDDMEVTAVGHAGHSEEDWGDKKVYSYENIIDNKIAYLEAMVEKNPKVNFVLIGHSIGAHIVMNIMKMRPDLPIARALYLFPFIRRDKTCFKQRIISLLLNAPGVRHLLCAIIVTIGTLVPRRLLAHIIRKGASLDDWCTKVTMNFLFRWTSVMNHLYMAKTEFKAVPFELPWADVLANTRKTKYVYTPNDHWGPIEDGRSIQKEAVNVHLEESEGVTHAFVSGASERIATVCADDILSCLEDGVIVPRIPPSP